MRKDLSIEQQSVQAIHAAMEAARHFLPVGQTHPHLALLGVESENQLLIALDRIQSAGIKVQKFHEPDIGGQLTAIATESLSGDRRKLFKRYRLLQHKDEESPHVVATLRLYKRLLALDQEGKNDSVEADEIRDQVDFHWRNLTHVELDYVREKCVELSGDSLKGNDHV